jgi:hypothetical protein
MQIRTGMIMKHQCPFFFPAEFPVRYSILNPMRCCNFSLIRGTCVIGDTHLVSQNNSVVPYPTEFNSIRPALTA